MPRRFIVTYDYTETVNGEPRAFVHETIIEAADLSDANLLALHHFDDLARLSGVSWRRVLTRCEVKAAPRDAIAKGGRRVYTDRTVDE